VLERNLTLPAFSFSGGVFTKGLNMRRKPARYRLSSTACRELFYAEDSLSALGREVRLERSNLAHIVKGARVRRGAQIEDRESSSLTRT
jgi:hypothetical protein